jgi:hypothetical protein
MGSARPTLPFGGVPVRHLLRAGGRSALGRDYQVVNTAMSWPGGRVHRDGTPTRHRLVFVPLDDAAVGPGYVKVTYDKKPVKDAPSIGPDGELPAGDEEAVFKHWGLAYQPGPGGERRRGPRAPPD